MLADERGALVPFSDPQALATQVIDLLGNESKRHAMRKRAYLFGRDMIWPQVARRYMKTFERARAEHHYHAASEFAVRPLDTRAGELPPLKLTHLHHLTDETGILQHAIFTIPNYREGYTTDDNARALMVSVLLEELGNTEATDLATRYLAFTWYAFNTESRRFRNFMDYQRNWLEESGSDDSHGRALWALGILLGRSNAPTLHHMASRVFQQSLLAILETTSPRAWAFALIGIYEYLQRFAGDRRVSQVQEELANRLLALYQDNCAAGWNWFENRLTYCNAALSHAMLVCGTSIPNAKMTEVGLESLRWLAELQHADSEGKHFVPIGSNGFYQQGGERARFDQQPVEAQAMVSACLEAHHITGEKSWHKERKPAAPSNGFWGETICTSRCTTRQPVAAAMVCILIGRTRIKAQSLLLHFSSLC
ncbi:MAG TPA: hypothetical protein VFR47_18400 [Anaerolineales bacterium]|nr:hypothetical protein [Anaerolineales bacterium]